MQKKNSLKLLGDSLVVRARKSVGTQHSENLEKILWYLFWDNWQSEAKQFSFFRLTHVVWKWPLVFHFCKKKFLHMCRFLCYIFIFVTYIWDRKYVALIDILLWKENFFFAIWILNVAIFIFCKEKIQNLMANST